VEPTLLLCSASPRRRELLSGLGIGFGALAPAVDETPLPGEGPKALAQRLSRLKVDAGLGAFRESGAEAPVVALAADTVVALGNEIFNKPRDRIDAARMLSALSGTEHAVITGVSVVGTRGAHRSCVVETRVRFRPLSPAQVRWLAGSGDGDDKAGAYAVQGLAGGFVEKLEGSASNVVGLPLAETLDLLAWAGLRLPWDDGEEAG
jgi:septum formation protein